jgi:aminoglycoside phosphotransferase (APT) family kinase protein
VASAKLSDESIDRLINVPRLTDWMNEQQLSRGPITSITRLGGGSQNVILRVTKGNRDFILRRPPASARAESNETMRREARILSAIAETDVPHPRVLAVCGDEEILGVAFYLMEPVDGFSATTGMPPLHAHNPAIRHQMGLALVDGAAALGRVDYHAVGLDGFGKPEGYLERQVARWQSQLESYRHYEGWPGPMSLPGLTLLAEYLEACRPAASKPGIIHGDYSIGNVMYRYDGPELAAIVDWELATIGDPLIDLGWILATWQGKGEIDLGVLRVAPSDGFPTPSELIDRYAVQSIRDLSSIDWYVVMACFKLAIILEGTFARALAGRDPMATGLKLHTAAIRLCERAHRRIG